MKSKTAGREASIRWGLKKESSGKDSQNVGWSGGLGDRKACRHYPERQERITQGATCTCGPSGTGEVQSIVSAIIDVGHGEAVPK
jgi:hypothetical protein